MIMEFLKDFQKVFAIHSDAALVQGYRNSKIIEEDVK